MHKKLISLLVLFILLFVVGSIAAQEPTEPAPEATEAPVIEVLPTDGGTVVNVNPPVEPEPEKGISLPVVVALVLSAISIFKIVFDAFLNPTQRAQILGVGDTARDIAWSVGMTIEQGIVMLGGHPEVEISQDPKAIARALRDKDRHVFIHSSVDVDAVIKAYQEESL